MCLVIRFHPHQYLTRPVQVGLIGIFFSGMTLVWFAPLLEHQSPLFNGFETFLEKFNAAFGDLDKMHVQHENIISLSRITFSCNICIEVQTIGL
jgi:hypothetical protein